MTPSRITPVRTSQSFVPPAGAASKEGDEAEIAIDDDDVIDIVAEKRCDAYTSQLSFILNPCGTRLLRRLDLRILPAFALMFTLWSLASNLVSTQPSQTSDRRLTEY